MSKTLTKSQEDFDNSAQNQMHVTGAPEFKEHYKYKIVNSAGI